MNAQNHVASPAAPYSREDLLAQEDALMAQLAAVESATRRLEGQLDTVALQLRALTQQTLFPTDQTLATAR
jgi:hypothetical protein